jgi:type IV pilus assembly protein PilN
MILRVNLLPYRDARRQRMVQAIIAAWGGTLIVGLGIVLLVSSAISDHIGVQLFTKMKNKTVIANLDKKLGEIKDLKERQKQVKARLGIIKTLGLQRNLPVFLLDAISGAIPDNIWLSNISTTDRGLSIVGNTLSNAMVADFMRRLDLSPYITRVNLNNIAQARSKKKRNQNLKLRQFTLSATIVMPTSSKQKGPAPDKGGK